MKMVLFGYIALCLGTLIFIIALIAHFSVGSDEMKAGVIKQLPHGCTIEDLGAWPGVDHVLMIRCGSDTTVDYVVPKGKTRQTVTVYSAD